jgi:hypothetical protein
MIGQYGNGTHLFGSNLVPSHVPIENNIQAIFIQAGFAD